MAFSTHIISITCIQCGARVNDLQRECEGVCHILISISVPLPGTFGLWFSPSIDAWTLPTLKSNDSIALTYVNHYSKGEKFVLDAGVTYQTLFTSFNQRLS